MKKILALTLCFVLVLSFAACGKKNEEKKEDKIDLDYYIRLGKMPECEFTLGVKGSDIIKDKSEEEYMMQEGFAHVLIAIDNVNYYYDKGDETETVNLIASFNGAFGFKQGEQKSVIIDKLAKSDLNAKEEPLSEDETYFFPVSGNFTGVKYTYGDNTACFVFNAAGTLAACSLYTNAN